jgi:S1-C subfamily serine protease
MTGSTLAILLTLGLNYAATASPLQDDAPQFILVSAPASILGVGVADIDVHSAELLNLKSTSGVEVIAVDHDAPAGKAGMHLRDVIIALNGKQVTSAAQFRETVGSFPPHKEVVLGVIRDGKPIKFTIKLADRAKLQQQAYARHFNPPMPSIGNTFGSVSARQGIFAGDGPQGLANEGAGDDSIDDGPQAFGFYGMGAELDPIGPQLASFFGVKDGSGMLVKSVAPGSPAAAAGLQAGDVVLKLNDASILNPVDWVRAIEASHGKPMPLTIVRNKHTETLTLLPPTRTQALLDWPQM